MPLTKVIPISADRIRETLKTHGATVEFRKKDGSIRRMECLSYADIPDCTTKRTRASKADPDLIVAWEKDNGFRSFHAQSVVLFCPVARVASPKPEGRKKRDSFRIWLSGIDMPKRGRWFCPDMLA